MYKNPVDLVERLEWSAYFREKDLNITVSTFHSSLTLWYKVPGTIIIIIIIIIFGISFTQGI
jgi:hypothetical protein